MAVRIPDESRDSRNLKGFRKSLSSKSPRLGRAKLNRAPRRAHQGFDIPESARYHGHLMATRDKKRYQCDSSETRLRVMQEARQHELDAHRQRTSRTFSMILVGAIFLVTGAIWLFPAAPADSGQAAATPPAQQPSAGEAAAPPRLATRTPDSTNPANPPGSPTAVKAVTDDATKASIAMP